jgi:hypothetical protein
MRNEKYVWNYVRKSLKEETTLINNYVYRYEGNNLKIDPKEMKWEDVNWIHLIQDYWERDNVNSVSMKVRQFLV